MLYPPQESPGKHLDVPVAPDKQQFVGVPIFPRLTRAIEDYSTLSGNDFRGLADGPATYRFSGQGYHSHHPRIQSGPKSAGKVLSRGLRVHFSVQPARVPMAAFQTLLKASDGSRPLHYDWLWA